MTIEPLTIAAVMRLGPVIPVLVVDDVAHARPIAEALVAGGLPALEVTLRTKAALDVIRAMAEVKGAVVGAGTVLSPEELEQSVGAGARFIVSPGLTKPLVRAAEAAAIPFLPGVENAGDIMRGLDLGLDRFKFFPAVASGGIRTLKALSAPFANVRFCPTGGITETTMHEWLAMETVDCVGGSWLVNGRDPSPSSIKAAAQRAARDTVEKDKVLGPVI